MASTGSCFEASMTCVAPIDFATSSFEATISTAIIGKHPAIDAPWIAQRPMPPQPKTAKLSPGCGAAVLNATPSPVGIAQPNNAASLSEKSCAIGVRRFSLIIEDWLNVVIAPAFTFWPLQSKIDPATLAPVPLIQDK